MRSPELVTGRALLIKAIKPMQNWYYKTWADVIASQKAKRAGNTNWKLYTIVPVSLLQGINLFTLFYWLRIIFSRNLLLTMPAEVFHARPLNGFISVMITFFIPFVLLNYLLIFYNNRYDILIAKYGSLSGKLYRKYALYSLGLAIIPIIIKVAFFG